MHPDKHINPDLSESGQQSTQNVGQNTSDFDGVMVFRALGYVVGLLSFMVGTAIAMLAYSLQTPSLGSTACVLYSLAIVALAGRPVLRKMNPSTEWQALAIILGVLVVGSLLFLLLRTAFLWIGLPT
jgi:hypothetical protein